MSRFIDELVNTMRCDIKTDDKISKAAPKLTTNANEPLKTREINGRVNKIINCIAKTKPFYRLNNLRGEGLIKRKFICPNKRFRSDGRNKILYNLIK